MEGAAMLADGVEAAAGELGHYDAAEDQAGNLTELSDGKGTGGSRNGLLGAAAGR